MSGVIGAVGGGAVVSIVAGASSSNNCSGTRLEELPWVLLLIFAVLIISFLIAVIRTPTK